MSERYRFFNFIMGTVGLKYHNMGLRTEIQKCGIVTHISPYYK